MTEEDRSPLILPARADFREPIILRNCVHIHLGVLIWMNGLIRDRIRWKKTGLACIEFESIEARPDLITLDVMMPSMDGWQVLRDLAQNPATQHIPVIVCSVLKEPELAFSLGARAYLKKPVDRLELLATLARLRPAAGPSAAARPPATEGN